MSILVIIITVFAVLGGIDYIIGEKFGIGKEFKKAFMLLGNMALTMPGMIVLSPLIAEWLSPVLLWIYGLLGIDPSLLPAMLFACDMGGAPLATEVAVDSELGLFNALVVSSMMGATVSFTIPFSLGLTKKENQKELLFGLLCGIVTIPIGCFASGIICRIDILPLIINILPLIILSLVLSAALIFVPNICIKVFGVFGVGVKALIVVGLILGSINFLADEPVIQGLASVEEAIVICLNASIVMCGMLPLIYVVSRLLSKPISRIGERLGVNEKSATGIFASLATCFITFGYINDMDKKGIVINSAFAVSAAFTFAEHLAFTMAFNSKYVLAVIIGKLVSGVCALALSLLLYSKLNKEQPQ